MTSLLTNNAAMTALTTLKSINTQLDATSNRVSTGQRVSAAADNAAYWSIATTVRTDNASLSAVKDSLGLGSSAVDTAYNGLNSILTDLQNLRAKLQTALQPGVDRSKVQTEISAIQSKMKATADSSVSSGQNWLSVDSSDPASYKPTQSIVAGFSRDSGGNINLSNVDVKVSTIALYDANTANRVDTPATTAMLTGSKALTGTIDFSGTNEVAFSIVSVIDANNTEGAKIVLNKDTLKTAVADLAKVTVNEVLDAINNQIAASGDANLRGKVKAALDNDGRLTFETTAGTNLGTDNAVGGTAGTAAADSVAAAGGSARTVTVQNVARSATGQVRLDIGFGVTAAPDLIAANSYNNIALTGTATTFTIDDGSGAQTVSLTNTSTNAAGTAPASYASVTGSEMAGLINKALTTAGSKASVSFDATSGKFVVTSTLVGTGASVTIGGTDFAKFGFSSAQTQAGTGAAGTTSTFSAQGTDAGTTQVKGILDTVDGSTNFSIQSIDLNALATGDTGDLRLKKVITQLDKAIAKVTDAGTQLGAKKTQVDGQKSFIDTLMKANDRTIGILVDADIEEESTKLKALQTQQQLAVQALSIANSSSQNVLSLFR